MNYVCNQCAVDCIETGLLDPGLCCYCALEQGTPEQRYRAKEMIDELEASYSWLNSIPGLGVM